MPSNPAMDEMNDAVDRLVKSGTYPSRAAVLEAGVQLVDAQQKTLEALEAAIDASLEDVDAGRIHAADDVFAGLRLRYSAMMDQKQGE